MPHKLCLVGGFSHPPKRYESNWVHLHQIGVNIKNIWVATTWLLTFIPKLFRVEKYLILVCSIPSPVGAWTSHLKNIRQLGSFPQVGGENNYFTSSDPHHDMLGGGCQVRVVIENMMGRMENLRTLISGFLGLVILVRWTLVTMFLSWTTQTGCRIHRTYVSLIGSGEGRHTTHLLKCVLLLSTSHTDWKQSSDVLSDISFNILSDVSSDISSDILSDISVDILSDISSDILSGIFLTYLLTFFLTYLLTCFLTYLLTFFLTYQNQNLTSTAS